MLIFFHDLHGAFPCGSAGKIAELSTMLGLG